MVASLMLERCGELDRSNSIVTFMFDEMNDATKRLGAYVMSMVLIRDKLHMANQSYLCDLCNVALVTMIHEVFSDYHAFQKFASRGHGCTRLAKDKLVGISFASGANSLDKESAWMFVTPGTCSKRST